MTETEFTKLVEQVIQNLPKPLQSFIEVCAPVIIDNEITPEIINDITNENPGWQPSNLQYASYHGLWYGYYRAGVKSHIRLYWKTIMKHPKANKEKVIYDCIVDGIGNLLGLWKTIEGATK